MPELELTRPELEAVIEAMVLHRCNHDGDEAYNTLLAELHVKLENALELWIHGGETEIPVPPAMRAIGVQRWYKVCPPHDEGIKE